MLRIFIFSGILLICAACSTFLDKKNKDVSLCTINDFSPKEIQRLAKPAFVQIDLGEPAGIRSLQRQSKVFIDEIIREELKKIGVTSDNEKLLFLLKPRMGLTVFYVGKLDKPEFTKTVLVTALTLMQQLGVGVGPVGTVLISQDFDFFGTHKDELIVKINDVQGGLNKLHYDVKQALLVAHQYHAILYPDQEALFSREIGERFAYLPHVSLGRLRLSEFVELGKEHGVDGYGLFERIKRRVLSEVVQKMFIEETLRVLNIHNFSIYTDQSNPWATFNLML